MDESDVLQMNDMECDVCGDRRFQEREGYYYCVECGTKKEQLRAVEISAEDTFNDTSKQALQRSIRKPKAKEGEGGDNDITSWEFYNYVLRGFLEELIHMGAKPELKLMTLQVWAAYMSRMEVAFCKNNELGLPKLNVRVLARDARIIYNHKRNKRKRERHNKATARGGDERANWREWRKTKRKLDMSGARSESTLPTAQSLQLQWSTLARKTLKQQMPLKHLDKHSVDSSGSMRCHPLNPKTRSLTHFDRNIYCLNISKLYVVLAIALNQVEDDIQLTDLLRLIDEEHLTSRYMLNYLPENVAMHGKTLLKQMEFGHQQDKFRYKFIRSHIAHMARFIDLNGYQMPNLGALAQRYVLELNLPPVVGSYVGNLLELLPPNFKSRGAQNYPRYEARVMAYIIYVLKLLFGLDDAKEHAISESAVQLNEQLAELAEQEGEGEGEEQAIAPLFVYTEWMQFVELRKVLVSHYDESFARRHGVPTRSERQVDEFLAKEHKQREQEYNYNEMMITPAMQRLRENICLIFETLLKQKYGTGTGTGDGDGGTRDQIEFQPTLTAAHSYFKRILLRAEQAPPDELSVQIPDCMRVDHTERQLAPFKNQITELQQYLRAYGYSLRTEELACQQDFEPVGIYQSLERNVNKFKEYRANCEIKTQAWLDDLRRREKRPDFVFRQPVAHYGKQYQNKIKERSRRRQALEADNPFWRLNATPNYVLKLRNDEEMSLNSLASIQTFEECNMEPLRVPLQMPRRQMAEEAVLLQEVQPKLEPGMHVRQSQSETESELLLKVSNFDCWLLHGCLSKLRDCDKQELRSNFPCSFRWLLETCAATIGVEWEVLYEQLLVVEVMFHHGIDWSNHSSHLRLKYNLLNKDMNTLTKSFREMW
ncbi:hypothetical protein KR222_002435 [Zaprionus bogoriensis]|nr:hypothetical protein KR222_002435 [Zaprionus bogoriensis]